MWQTLRLAICSACWLSLPLAANADWRDDVGLTKLEAALGDQMLTGQGVFISQVEAGWDGDTNRYLPDPDAHFSAGLDPFGELPTFINGSAGAHSDPEISPHATNSVAKIYYGDSVGPAPGANTIVIYEANDYLSSFLNGTGNTTPQRSSTPPIPS
jgi:hypothetical protein